MKNTVGNVVTLPNIEKKEAVKAAKGIITFLTGVLAERTNPANTVDWTSISDTLRQNADNLVEYRTTLYENLDRLGGDLSTLANIILNNTDTYAVEEEEE